MKNIFVWGLSGAGKDTISNHLASEYDYVKMRIALTIKIIICESQGLTLEQLEEQKRANPTLRKMHHQVSQMLDELAGINQSSLQRLALIIQRKSFDFDLLTDKNKPIVITDTRTIEETRMMLQNGFHGIFLTRRALEYRENNHFTEKFIFEDEQFRGLYNMYANNITIIDNTGFKFYDGKIEYPISFTDGSADQLFELIGRFMTIGIFD